MANTHPRCLYTLDINTGIPAAAYDWTAANNNVITVNASTIGQEELIQAQATNANQHCCNEPPNIDSRLDSDSMLLHGEEMLNNVRENDRLLINHKIEKWDIKIYTFMCKVVQLTGYMAALAKNCNHLRGLRNVDNKIVQFSWWKSGCEQECPFPIDQELYRPSGVAHLDANKSTSSTSTKVAAATYLDNQNELNILSNVGDGIRCQIFDNSDCSNSSTVEEELLCTNSGLIGTVLGHAVARSSWGKSRCE
jgi:hypothetical protein